MNQSPTDTSAHCCDQLPARLGGGGPESRLHACLCAGLHTSAAGLTAIYRSRCELASAGPSAEAPVHIQVRPSTYDSAREIWATRHTRTNQMSRQQKVASFTHQPSALEL